MYTAITFVVISVVILIFYAVDSLLRWVWQRHKKRKEKISSEGEDTSRSIKEIERLLPAGYRLDSTDKKWAADPYAVFLQAKQKDGAWKTISQKLLAVGGATSKTGLVLLPDQGRHFIPLSNSLGSYFQVHVEEQNIPEGYGSLFDQK